MTNVVVVLTTMPDDARTDEVSRVLVEERLAACVNVHAPMTSTYRWKGAIAREAERQLTIKTTADRVDALRTRLRELHPYELPEFLVLRADGGSDEYLEWIESSVARSVRI
jgi:periplasmic divalent cation tolerance protein